MRPPRRLLQGLVALAIIAGVYRLTSRDAAPGLTPSAASELAGVRFLELLTGGARSGDTLPLVIGMHGRTGRPERFAQALEALQVPARIVLPYGSEPAMNGFAWFPNPTSEETFAAGLRKSADRLAPMIAELIATRPTAGRAIVVGFSQGGMMSFALAVLHPEVVKAAVPVAGTLARGLIPDAWPRGAAMPHILAIHGTDDDVVPIEGDRTTVARLRTVGFRVELSELPGARHELSPDMRAALVQAVSRALKE